MLGGIDSVKCRERIYRGFARGSTQRYAHDPPPPLGFLMYDAVTKKKNTLQFRMHFITGFRSSTN